MVLLRISRSEAISFTFEDLKNYIQIPYTTFSHYILRDVFIIMILCKSNFSFWSFLGFFSTL